MWLAFRRSPGTLSRTFTFFPFGFNSMCSHGHKSVVQLISSLWSYAKVCGILEGFFFLKSKCNIENVILLIFFCIFVGNPHEDRCFGRLYK